MFFFGLEIDSWGVIMSSKLSSSRSSVRPLSFDGVESVPVDDISGLFSRQNEPASYD